MVKLKFEFTKSKQGNRRVQTSPRSAEFSGATWRLTVSNSLRRRLPSLCLVWLMTSSRKPEVRNALHCRQRRAELRPLVTCTENFMKFGHVAYLISDMRADRQTETQTYRSQYFAPRPRGGAKQIFELVFSHYQLIRNFTLNSTLHTYIRTNLYSAATAVIQLHKPRCRFAQRFIRRRRFYVDRRSPVNDDCRRIYDITWRQKFTI